MKKIIPLVASIALILVAGIFASAGSLAWYSDTEKVKVDPVAHTLDLTLNGENAEITFAIGMVKPGDKGTSPVYKLKNVGNTAGELDIHLIDVVNTESTGDTEFEQDDIGGAGVGELGDHLDVHFKMSGGTYGSWVNMWGGYDQGKPLNTLSGIKWDGGDDYPDGGAIKPACSVSGTYLLDPGEEIAFHIWWWVQGDVGNEIQGDSVSFTLKFVLEQPDVD